MLFGADRAVYYLESPTETLSEMDGSRVKGIRQSLEKFLKSPDSAFDKQILPFLHQARDLNTNTRAFATWCTDGDSNREICVVQAIYRKRNESEYFKYKNVYNDEGRDWQERFEGLTDLQYEDWIETATKNSEVIIVAN